MNDHPHHDGSPLYKDGSRVRVNASEAPVMRSVVDGEPRYTPMELEREGWWTAVVPSRNPVTPYRFLFPGGRWLTAAGFTNRDVNDDTDFRHVRNFSAPSWMADAVIYQIFPDRFASTSTKPLPDWAWPADWDTTEVIGKGPGTPEQFYGGDLDGIVSRLDYIQSLGVNTVYLTPIFPGRSNHRYDASTFDAIDPLLGGEAALARLADALHDRGMRLIGDITTNHVGISHDWFQSSPEMFYIAPDGSYESWCGVPSLPKLNWSNPLVWERMTSVMLHWLKYFDGWRVDVANMTGRNGDEDRAHEIAAYLRAAMPSETMLVAEHAHDASGDLDRGGWQGTMNYLGFTRPVWSWLVGPDCDLPDFMGMPGGVPTRDGKSIVDTMRQASARMSWETFTHSWQLLDSHDSARIRTVVGSRERHLTALALQMTLPGTPMIFAGSEFGLTGANGEYSRTPMPWNRPIDTEMLTAYREWVALRNAHPALRQGSLRWLDVSADSISFAREHPAETLTYTFYR